MSRLMDRLARALFVLGIAGALAFGTRAALAADRVSNCLCDPEDPDADRFCESFECCNSAGSICPLGGSGLRECLCV